MGRYISIAGCIAPWNPARNEIVNASECVSAERHHRRELQSIFTFEIRSGATRERCGINTFHKLPSNIDSDYDCKISKGIKNSLPVRKHHTQRKKPASYIIPVIYAANFLHLFKF